MNSLKLFLKGKDFLTRSSKSISSNCKFGCFTLMNLYISLNEIFKIDLGPIANLPKLQNVEHTHEINKIYNIILN